MSGSALRDGKRRPVMVWFHEGILSGTSNINLYDGTRLCLRGDVVVVNGESRLNTLRIFVSRGSLRLGISGIGNSRYARSHLALQWIQENISEFGGDPKKCYDFRTVRRGAKCCNTHALAGSSRTVPESHHTKRQH